MLAKSFNEIRRANENKATFKQNTRVVLSGQRKAPNDTELNVIRTRFVGQREIVTVAHYIDGKYFSYDVDVKFIKETKSPKVRTFSRMA